MSGFVCLTDNWQIKIGLFLFVLDILFSFVFEMIFPIAGTFIVFTTTLGLSILICFVWFVEMYTNHHFQTISEHSMFPITQQHKIMAMMCTAIGITMVGIHSRFQQLIVLLGRNCFDYSEHTPILLAILGDYFILITGFFPTSLEENDEKYLDDKLYITNSNGKKLIENKKGNEVNRDEENCDGKLSKSGSIRIYRVKSNKNKTDKEIGIEDIDMVSSHSRCLHLVGVGIYVTCQIIYITWGGNQWLKNESVTAYIVLLVLIFLTLILFIVATLIKKKNRKEDDPGDKKHNLFVLIMELFLLLLPTLISASLTLFWSSRAIDWFNCEVPGEICPIIDSKVRCITD